MIYAQPVVSPRIWISVSGAAAGEEAEKRGRENSGPSCSEVSCENPPVPPPHRLTSAEISVSLFLCLF